MGKGKGKDESNGGKGKWDNGKGKYGPKGGKGRNWDNNGKGKDGSNGGKGRNWDNNGKGKGGKNKGGKGKGNGAEINSSNAPTCGPLHTLKVVGESLSNSNSPETTITAFCGHIGISLNDNLCTDCRNMFVGIVGVIIKAIVNNKNAHNKDAEVLLKDIQKNDVFMDVCHDPPGDSKSRASIHAALLGLLQREGVKGLLVRQIARSYGKKVGLAEDDELMLVLSHLDEEKKEQQLKTGPTVDAPLMMKAIPRENAPLLPELNDLLTPSYEVVRHIPVAQTTTALNDMDNHLNVLYQLMREDFMLPLRDGIQAAKVRLSKAFHTMSPEDLKKKSLMVYTYPEVKYSGSYIDKKQGVLQSFKAFQPPNRAPINWSKRLLNGNLVVISPFQGKDTPIDSNFVCGVVVSRRKGNSIDVRRANFEAHFEFDVCFSDLGVDYSTLMKFFVPEKTYHFTESKAFFVPTFRALKSLKEVNVKDIRHYVNSISSGHTDLPMFLRERESVSLEDVVDISPNESPELQLGTFEQLQAQAKHVFRDWTYEREQELGTKTVHVVDATQRDAIVLSLTANVVTIKGTPGTGKTFIGGKIAQLYFKNKLLDDHPMLVITLTNHALDSFTRDLLLYESPEQIVRIGKPSNDPEITKLSLPNRTPINNPHVRFLGKTCWRLENEFRLATERVTRPIEVRDDEEVARLFDSATGIPQHWKDWWTKCQEEREARRKAHDMLLSEKEGLNNRVRCVRKQIKAETEKRTAQKRKSKDGEADVNENSCDPHILNQKKALERSIKKQLKEIHSRIAANENANSQIFHSWLNGLGVVPPDNEDDEVPPSKEPTDPEAHSDQDDLEKYEAERDDDRWDPNADPTSDKDEEPITTFEVPPWMNYAERKKWLQWLKCNHPNDCDTAQKRGDAWKCLKREFAASEFDKIREICNEYDEKRKELRRYDDEHQAQQLGRYRVIVATTAGAMQMLPILRKVNVRVVMVEEVGEVPEAHVLACITPSVQQLILIGDDKQLQPKLTDNRLEKKGLAVSLMQRLVNLGIKSVTLTVQRRMHPKISAFVKEYYLSKPPHYSGEEVVITDHPSTNHRKALDGVTPGTRFCWVDSSHSTEHVHQGSQSPENADEAEFVLLIAEYLRQIGAVPAHDIALITPYKGQLLKLMEMAKKKNIAWSGRHEANKFRFATIDDYQGEEQDVVILSLVRTSKTQGFLAKQNRACVALSRAKRFMCIVGSVTVFDDIKGNALWREALTRCRDAGALSESFPGYCQHHTASLAFTPKNRQQVMNNYFGCLNEVCGERIQECGHSCKHLCHPSNDPDHKDWECFERCGRVGERCKKAPGRNCDHPCPKLCKDDCGHCRVELRQVVPPCGDEEHSYTILCHQLSSLPKCKKLITRILPCGHTLKAPCHEWPRDGSDAVGLQSRCKAACDDALKCGHKCRARCHYGKGHPQCEQRVTARRECGHGTVNYECAKGARSVKCRSICGATSECKHKCVLPCFECDGNHRCDADVDMKPRPTCGHYGKYKCPFAKQNPGDFADACDAPCGHTLLCGHECQEKCVKCQKSTHPPCQKPDPRRLFCGHDVKKQCGYAAAPCAEECLRTCEHRVTCRHGKHRCGECKAVPCREPCAWECDHEKCELLCHEECERPVCNQRCPKTLACGHLCEGVCGETCPSLCLECWKKANHDLPPVRSLGVVFLDDDELREYFTNRTLPEDVEEWEALLAELTCGCRFFASELDRTIQSLQGSDRSIEMASCPHCRTPILPHHYKRQGGILRQIRNNVAAVAKKVQNRANEVEGLRDDVINKLSELVEADLPGWVDKLKILRSQQPTKPAPLKLNPKPRGKKEQSQNKELTKQHNEQMKKYKSESDRFVTGLSHLKQEVKMVVNTITKMPAAAAFILCVQLHSPESSVSFTGKTGAERAANMQNTVQALYTVSAAVKAYADAKSEYSAVGEDKTLQKVFNATALAKLSDSMSPESTAAPIHHRRFSRAALLVRVIMLHHIATQRPSVPVSHCGVVATTFPTAGDGGRVLNSLGQAGLNRFLDELLTSAVRFVRTTARGANRVHYHHQQRSESFLAENMCLRRRCAALQRFFNGVATTYGTKFDPTVCLRELTLAFHGTASENVGAMMCQGFDPNRRAGQAYGPGEYFGRTFDVSHGYTKGAQMMIVCAILRTSLLSDHNAILVLNNPTNQPSIQFVLPVGVLIYGNIQNDFDRCCSPQPARVPHIERMVSNVRDALETVPNGFDEREFETELKKLEKHYELRPAQPAEILNFAKAMGLSAGHAYMCPNGHVYFIGECGGAVLESTCNECGARIGGQGHRARDDNHFAARLLGLDANPAWPGQP